MYYVGYNERYDTSRYGISKMKEKKYRCIRLYESGEGGKYRESMCGEYKYDYVEFILGRSAYIGKVVVYNMLMILKYVLIKLI